MLAIKATHTRDRIEKRTGTEVISKSRTKHISTQKSITHSDALYNIYFYEHEIWGESSNPIQGTHTGMYLSIC